MPETSTAELQALHDHIAGHLAELHQGLNDLPLATVLARHPAKPGRYVIVTNESDEAAERLKEAIGADADGELTTPPPVLDPVHERLVRYLAFKLEADTTWRARNGDDYEDGYGEAMHDLALYLLDDHALDQILGDPGMFEGDQRERTKARTADLRERGYEAWLEATAEDDGDA